MVFSSAAVDDIDGQTWLADVLAGIVDHPARRIGELMRWNWKPTFGLQTAGANQAT